MMHSNLSINSGEKERMELTSNNIAVSSISDGLVASWHFDENGSDPIPGDQKDIYDATSNHNDGKLGPTGEFQESNDSTWVEGISGTALNFDGVDDYMEINNSNILNSVNSLTIAAWIKVSSTSGLKYFVLTSGFGLWYTTIPFPKLGLAIHIPTTDSAYGNITLDKWEFIAGTYNGTHICFYLNGNPTQTKNHTGTMNYGSLNLVFGYFSNKNWNGTIDEFQIWNRVLTQNEIQNIYLSFNGEKTGIPGFNLLITTFIIVAVMSLMIIQKTYRKLSKPRFNLK
jgi:hypothetical protein